MIKGGQTDVLGLKKAFLKDFLVVLGDLDVAELAMSAVVDGHLLFDFDELLEVMVKRVSWCVGVDLHLIIITNHPHLFI